MRDIIAAREWESFVSDERASAWEMQLADALQSLRTMPERCPIAKEHSSSELIVRRKLFGAGRGVYKIYFQVKDGVVNVLHCRHAARLGLDAIL